MLFFSCSHLNDAFSVLATDASTFPPTALTNITVATTVNKTNLHPTGVAPHEESHTEIEEELHKQAHIDYNRVAIISHPSVPALYEDALVYEPGSGISSTGALTAYSGKKTGRSPSDKRIVQEPSSEKDIWWGPVNKPMSPEVCLVFVFLQCWLLCLGCISAPITHSPFTCLPHSHLHGHATNWITMLIPPGLEDQPRACH